IGDKHFYYIDQFRIDAGVRLLSRRPYGSAHAKGFRSALYSGRTAGSNRDQRRVNDRGPSRHFVEEVNAWRIVGNTTRYDSSFNVRRRLNGGYLFKGRPLAKQLSDRHSPRAAREQNKPGPTPPGG